MVDNIPDKPTRFTILPGNIILSLKTQALQNLLPGYTRVGHIQQYFCQSAIASSQHSLEQGLLGIVKFDSNV